MEYQMHAELGSAGSESLGSARSPLRNAASQTVAGARRAASPARAAPSARATSPSQRRKAQEKAAPTLWTYETLTQLDCNVDDMTGEVIGHVLSTLMSGGALDAWITPIIMKKGRPASCLSVLCDEENINKLLEVVFRHTTTLGVRMNKVQRAALRRTYSRAVPTGFVTDECDGLVDVKMAWLGDDCVNIKPEFEDCRIVSEETGAPIKVVMDAAKARCLAQAAEQR